MKTRTTTKSEIKRSWHLIDAKDRVVGRLATEVAPLLMGKNKPYYVSHLDCGDFVVIINAKDVRFTGTKETKKQYYRHSGIPGGFRSQTVAEVRALKPEELVRKAVKGMIPHNRVGNSLMKKLFIYAGSEHPHTEVRNG